VPTQLNSTQLNFRPFTLQADARFLSFHGHEDCGLSCVTWWSEIITSGHRAIDCMWSKWAAVAAVSEMRGLEKTHHIPFKWSLSSVLRSARIFQWRCYSQPDKNTEHIATCLRLVWCAQTANSDHPNHIS